MRKIKRERVCALKREREGEEIGKGRRREREREGDNFEREFKI